MKQILKKNIFLILFIFSLGYVANDVVNKVGISIVDEAYAEEQRSKSSIRRIIENCDVEGGYVDGGYVDDGYLYGAYVYGLEIDC